MGRTLLLLLAVGAGCSSSGNNSDLGSGVTLSGAVLDYSTQALIADASVCIYQSTAVPPQETGCVQTTAAGAFRLPAPMNSQVLVSYRKGGYLPSILEITTTTTDAVLGGHTIITATDAMGFANSLLDPIDSSKPIVTVQVNAANNTLQAGATVMAAFNPGDGPFYFNEQGQPVKSLTATSSTGLAVWVNTMPGDVEITVTHGGAACPPHGSWPGTAANTVLAKVVGGYSTSVGVVCP
jgi:hypothetical protein